jgi:hypothetical protein
MRAAGVGSFAKCVAVRSLKVRNQSVRSAARALRSASRAASWTFTAVSPRAGNGSTTVSWHSRPCRTRLSSAVICSKIREDVGIKPMRYRRCRQGFPQRQPLSRRQGGKGEIRRGQRELRRIARGRLE